jgi:hypothetical protein
MASKTKQPSYEDEQRALTEIRDDIRSDEGRRRLGVALRSRRSLVAARAARLIKEHGVEGFAAELTDVFTRFLDNPVKSDPTCQAKLAAIEALDFAESMEAEPFLRAAKHVQWEGASDTAAPLRARAILALARIGPRDFGLMAARLLSDGQPPVRQAALDALAHRGDEAGAALALYKLGVGDEDPLVTLAAMTTLLALAPAWGLDELSTALDGDAEAAEGARAERRELAAVALGQSRRDDALALLIDRLERCVSQEEREPILRGIGLHRSERALATLIDIVTDGRAGDAAAAIVALGARRYEPGVASRVRAAAARNDADLTAALASVFPDGE